MLMFNKKFFLIIIIFSLLGACSSPTSMLGPIYTFSSTGNVLQTGLSYSSGKLIKRHTGKTPIENLREATIDYKPNIQKKTLESDDFFYLVKARLEKTSSIFKKSSQ